jgi:transposase-like protein
MKKGKRIHGAQFKGRVALEAAKGLRTMAELASEYEVHPVQIAKWKKQLFEGVADIFARRRERREQDEEELKARLYQQIGRLQVELDWLKKKAGLDG